MAAGPFRGLMTVVHLLGVRGKRAKAPAPVPRATQSKRRAKATVTDFSHLRAGADTTGRHVARSSTAAVVEHLSRAASAATPTRADAVRSWDAAHTRLTTRSNRL